MTLYGEEGQVKVQWVKTDADRQAQYRTTGLWSTGFNVEEFEIED